MGKTKFSSSAVTDKIEWWLGIMIVETLCVLQEAWAHNTASEWLWFACVASTAIRVWFLKNELSATYNVRLTGNKETDDAVLKRIADLFRGK